MISELEDRSVKNINTQWGKGGWKLKCSNIHETVVPEVKEKI